MRIICYTILPILLCFATDTRAQAAPMTAGGEATGDGNVSWSVGQPVYRTIEGTNGAINGGVQQPYVFQNTGVNNAPDIQLQLAVAPNPTRSNVRLLVDIAKYDRLEYELLGSNGQKLSSARVVSSGTDIEMDDLVSGTYLLRLSTEGKTLRTIRIIKAQ